MIHSATTPKAPIAASCRDERPLIRRDLQASWLRLQAPVRGSEAAVELSAGGDVRLRAVLRQRRLRRRKPRERHPVGRAGDVVEPELVAEGDRALLAAVLTADPDLQSGVGASSPLDPDPHQTAD